jgi:BirA family transcriptional regulator, biotin operon repressor / biotin---[acetyl-CoA-carboxylase] ligase
MRLDPAAAAAGFRLATYETLASTNAEALDCAQDQGADAGALWITARQQTAGRGRGGNRWSSSPGNLYATLLLVDPAPPRQAPQLSFVAALAVRDAILSCAPSLRTRLALKWPNDVLCGGAKLAGILIEGRTVGGTLAVAIGIGINCLHHPTQTSYPATDLAANGAQVSAEDVFLALSGAMLWRLRQWNGGAGFSAVRSAWIDGAAGIGGEVRVRLPGRELLGRWEALDEAGRLLLRLVDGSLQTIAAGDVFPLGDERSDRSLQDAACPDGAG